MCDTHMISSSITHIMRWMCATHDHLQVCSTHHDHHVMDTSWPSCDGHIITYTSSCWTSCDVVMHDHLPIITSSHHVLYTFDGPMWTSTKVTTFGWPPIWVELDSIWVSLVWITTQIELVEGDSHLKLKSQQHICDAESELEVILMTRASLLVKEEWYSLIQSIFLWLNHLLINHLIDNWCSIIF